MKRQGSALLITLVALVSAALALTIFHHHAVGLLQTARASLAASRAREAAGAGLASTAAGGALTGSLPGGALWVVSIDTMVPGMHLLRSTGRSTIPSVAMLEVAAILDATATSQGGGAWPTSPSGWVVIRPD